MHQILNLEMYTALRVLLPVTVLLPRKLVEKRPCQYPFAVAALLLVVRLAALAPIVIYSTIVIQFLTRTLLC